MEIKELHLRNIASIEKADIDFANGLNDSVTGTPASVFLISGDTGAGKSVVLDGISMALFKKTPRVEGVSETNNNEYTDNEGETIRIASIEQYTRLGISHKDDCYSEVVFNGNDGVNYRARLTLGFTLGNTDKQTGKRPLKHSKPKWEVRIGDADWTTDSVAETIEKAIGLNYDQFGRMAMLAQGQFATFLTGKKEEREEILQRLTNTEHFNDYGLAIKNIYDRVKTEVRVIQAQYKTTAGFVLKEEKVSEYEQQLKEASSKQQEVRKELDILNNRLQLIRTVTQNRTTIQAAGKVKEETERIRNGEQYKSYRSLVELWDATTNERQSLLLLKRAREDRKRSDETESMLLSRFNTLSADLAFRRQELSASAGLADKVNDLKMQIDTLSEENDRINIKLINSRLDDIVRKRTDLEKVRNLSLSLEQYRTRTEQLKKEISDNLQVITSEQAVTDDAQDRYEKAMQAALKARTRLASVESSLKDTLKNLRKSLVTENIDICPLCGQHLDNILSDDEFRGVVTPYEEECSEADKISAEALKVLNSAKSELEKLKGAQGIRTKQLASIESDIKNAHANLLSLAPKVDIDTTRPIGEQINTLSSALDEQERLLKKERQAATELQGKISTLMREKAQADRQYNEYKLSAQTVTAIEEICNGIIARFPAWQSDTTACSLNSGGIIQEWNRLSTDVGSLVTSRDTSDKAIKHNETILNAYYRSSGLGQQDLERISSRQAEIEQARRFISETDTKAERQNGIIETAQKLVDDAISRLGLSADDVFPDSSVIEQEKKEKDDQNARYLGLIATCRKALDDNSEHKKELEKVKAELDLAVAGCSKWEKLNSYFGGTRFRTLVQSYILRPLLNNANIYLSNITDRYALTCSQDNEKLSILVLDHYNKDQVRSATVLSGGERFMISLALSLALSSLNRPDMNVDILFIDEGFGTLDEKSLDSVMETLEKLQNIPGQGGRRVGIISHREELEERIPVKIQVVRKGQGRSVVI